MEKSALVKSADKIAKVQILKENVSEKAFSEILSIYNWFSVIFLILQLQAMKV